MSRESVADELRAAAIDCLQAINAMNLKRPHRFRSNLRSAVRRMDKALTDFEKLGIRRDERGRLVKKSRK